MSLDIGPGPRQGLVIAARWNEDTDWNGSPWPVEVVQKDRDLPNAGREASSYAWWVAPHHDRIDPDRTHAFVQGRPFDHGFHWGQLHEVGRFEPLGCHHLTELPDGSPHHPGLDLVRGWRLLEIPGTPPGEFAFAAGAQFLVSGRVLLGWDRTWWSHLQAETCEEKGPLSPWVLERLWPYLLGS